MKLASAAAAVLAVAAPLAAANPIFERAALPKCNADNCARAVTGTGPAYHTTAAADCNSFLLTTVTPSPSWATLTVATPLDIHIGIFVHNSAVTVVPTATPTYAAVCSNVVRYASACLCGGAQAATTTAHRPTYTVTVAAPKLVLTTLVA